MAIPRLFVPLPLNVGQNLPLEATQAHHITTVLRLMPGESVILFNGKGGEYLSKVISLKPCILEVTTHQPNTAELPGYLEWAQGWCQFEKMDWVVQKATEMGAQKIVLVKTQKAKIKNFDSDKKINHWQKIIAHSAAQCGRAQLPELVVISKLEHWIQTPFTGQSYFASLTTHTFAPTIPQGTGVRFLIGPEGGLSDTEVIQLTDAQLTPVSLGARILRTETAGIVLATLILHHQGLC